MVVLHNPLILPPYFLITLIFVACSIPLFFFVVGFSMTEEHEKQQVMAASCARTSMIGSGAEGMQSLEIDVSMDGFPKSLGISPRKTR